MRANAALLLLCAALAPRATLAAEDLDITGEQAIRDHVERQLKDVDVASLTDAQKRALLPKPLCLNLGMIVPIYGSYVLDHTLYGSTQYPAVIADWILGGFVPAGLVATALIGQQWFGELPRNLLLGSAGLLYLGTRVAVLLVINEHIRVYEATLRQRLGLGDASSSNAASAD